MGRAARRCCAAATAATVAAQLLLVLLAPVLAAAQSPTVVPAACRRVHIDDYLRDLPIVMNNRTSWSRFCQANMRSAGCSTECKKALQRVRGY